MHHLLKSATKSPRRIAASGAVIALMAVGTMGVASAADIPVHPVLPGAGGTKATNSILVRADLSAIKKAYDAGDKATMDAAIASLKTHLDTSLAAKAATTTTLAPTTSASPATTAAPVTSSVPTTSAPSPTTTPAPVATAPVGDFRDVIAKANGTVALGAGKYTMSDFGGLATSGGFLKNLSLTGAGMDKTTIELKAKTSTHAKDVPTATGTTNQLYLARVLTGSPTVSGFTITGGDQGHLYNGLEIGQTTNAKVSNVKITSVPGNNHFPPGETFGLNDWQTTGSVYTNVIVDGSGVGAAGIGTNSAKNVTFNNVKSNNNQYSMGITFWQTTGFMNVTDSDLSNDRTALNYEQDSGTSTLTRVKFGNNASWTSGHDINIGSNVGSVKITIVDPILPANGKIRVGGVFTGGGTYAGKPATQLKSDIKVMVGGVDKTSEIIQF